MMRLRDFSRISVLSWANIVVDYTLFEMQSYLTEVWKLSLVHAALILNILNGLSRIFPLFFLYLVDSFLGHFKLLLFTSLSYSAGLVMVTASTPPVANARCTSYEPECIGPTEKGLLYAGLALIAVGAAGNLASVKPFLAEQRERGGSNSLALQRQGYVYKVVNIVGVVVAIVVGGVLVPYITRPRILKFGIPAICSAVATFLFLTGSCSYVKAPPPYDSPLFNVFRVLVTSFLKRSQSYPDESDDYQRYHRTDEDVFSPTRCLRGLHKAAIILPGDDTKRSKSWTLCSVAQVEEAKIAVRMVPMCVTFIVFQIVASVGDTYFVEQASELSGTIWKLRLPIQVLLLAEGVTKVVVSNLVTKFLKRTKRATAPSSVIAAGMMCSISCCISAALVERKRLNVVRSHGLLDRPDEEMSMSMYWLLFQFVLLGGLESLLPAGMHAYYKHQSPDSMENYVDANIQGVTGLGYMCSVISVYGVGKMSEIGGHTNWFQHTLNRSRLDNYYLVLAALSTVAFVVFVVSAWCYSYKEVEEEGSEEGDAGRSYPFAFVEGIVWNLSHPTRFGPFRSSSIRRVGSSKSEA